MKGTQLPYSVQYALQRPGEHAGYVFLAGAFENVHVFPLLRCQSFLTFVIAISRRPLQGNAEVALVGHQSRALNSFCRSFDLSGNSYKSFPCLGGWFVVLNPWFQRNGKSAHIYTSKRMRGSLSRRCVARFVHRGCEDCGSPASPPPRATGGG